MNSHKFITTIGLLLIALSTTAQEKESAIGIWKGKVAGTDLILEISKDSSLTPKGYLSLPLQGIDSLSSTNATIFTDSLIFSFSAMGHKFEIMTNHGTDTLRGTFIQDKTTLVPIELIKVTTRIPLRLQNPQPPYNYKVEELSFYNHNADITLAGTLTTPLKIIDFPIVILISGSGLQNRDSEILGHKPFLVIADFLTRHGIGVFRYDERGIGASEGAAHNATSLDFKEDVLAAISKLDSQGYSQIGLIGHSEGGLIAPMAAIENSKIDFIITLAGPGQPIEEMMLLQNKLILEDQGLFEPETITAYLEFTENVYNLIDRDTPKEELFDPLKALCSEFYNSLESTVAKGFGESEFQFYVAYGMNMFNPWFRWFINYDPQPTIKKLSCPVLALNGNLDIQVPAEPNLAGFRQMLKESNTEHYKVAELDSLNHLFQKVKTHSTSEYYDSPETFNEDALKMIVEWIKRLKKRGN